MAEKKKKQVDKKWATHAFADVKEGKLTKLGYPDVQKMIAAARKDRAGVVRALLLLANGSKDPATKAHAKMIIGRIKKALGEAK